MTSRRISLLVATVLIGLSAGFFFTYEASVTLGLAEVGDLAYVQTFQSINETVRNPAFGVVFFGAVPAVLVATAVNWRSGSVVLRPLLVTAAALYLAGVAVTAIGNVPLNDDLADVTEVTASTAAAARANFEDSWNQLNLIRTVLIGASFLALAVACLAAPPGTDDRGGRALSGQTG